MLVKAGNVFGCLSRGQFMRYFNVLIIYLFIYLFIYNQNRTQNRKDVKLHKKDIKVT